MLKELMANTGAMTAWVPWVHGIEFELSYISRPELDAMVRKHTKIRMVKGRTTEQLDEEAFAAALVKRAIKGWRGVTLEALTRVIPISINGHDPDAELAFSVDDMALIANNAYGFADWLNRQLTDLETFRREKLEEEVKN